MRSDWGKLLDRAKVPLSAALVLLLLAAHALAASPSFHLELHDHAAVDHGACAAITVAQAHLEAPETGVFIPPQASVWGARIEDRPLVRFRFFSLASSRGPPALS